MISTLIDMTRAKGADLPETVIADVEFFLTINKAEAAENAILAYTKRHQRFPPEIHYYLALTFLARSDLVSAARELQLFPENLIRSPKIYYLRGLVGEKLNDPDSALRDYQKALKMTKTHAKSRLRIADILYQKGRLRDAADHLDFIVENPKLLAPKDLALAYYLHSQLAQSFQKLDLAIGDLERAVKLDRENHEYLLDLYNLRAKSGESVKSLRKEARMWFFLSEGEKRLAEGKFHDALTQFLQARQQNDHSAIPLIKIGDMFRNLHELANASINYRMAAERMPMNIEVWSKYIDVLIQSYEWKEATAAMDRFRKLPVPQSAIDKALEAFKSYSDRNPSDPSGYMERYAIYVRKTDFEKASDELSRIFGVYPKYPNLHYYKGLLYSAMQNHKVAIEELRLELANNARNVNAMVALGKELIFTENATQALEQLEKAMAMDPKSAEAKHQAGLANFKLKNYQGAVALFNAALVFDKGNPLIYKRMAMAYKEMGDMQSAFASCKKYVEMEPDAPDRADCDRLH